jgi:hypothetical protein
MNGRPSADLLKQSLAKMEEAGKHLTEFHAKVGQLREINKRHELLPEYTKALSNILRDHPPLERVSLSNKRFSNIASGGSPKLNLQKFGSNLDEVLASIQNDATIVAKQLDETMAAFREALPMAAQGGFAAYVLSGRAPLPEKIMQSADMFMVFTSFYSRACQATIAADMQVYPKGLEWLKKPSKGWK